MKKFMKKIGDAVLVFSPFLLFFFIRTAYLHQPEKSKDVPSEQVKSEKGEGIQSQENFQPGVIRFIVL